MRSLSLRPGDSLTIQKMALSMGFRPSVSLQSAIQATGFLVLTLAGLTPAEDASLLLDARRVESWRGSFRIRGVAVPGRFSPQRRCLNPIHSSVSSSRLLEPSVQFSRTGLPCPLHAKVYVTYRAGSAFACGL